jgi:hypothetical protein
MPRLAGPDREILRLAVPAFGALVAEPLFLLTDSAIVGRIGTTALGGLGVASQALTALVNVSIFLARGGQPSVNGSRVAPVSSTHTDLVSVYSRIASAPFSRPMPLAPNPPNGTCGPTTR